MPQPRDKRRGTVRSYALAIQNEDDRMPACKTEREERFAMFLAKGLNQTEAYEAAGYKRSGASASKAAQKPGVIARVKELRHQAAYRTRVTLRSLLEQAEDARFGAMTDKQYSAAVAAIREKGILSGLRVEKRNNISRPLNQMSDAELLAIAQSGGLMLDESLTESGFLALPAPGDESEPHE